ncbi:MAG: exopolygalacturonase [Planctomycetes bacterium]|nr:exopolygalacturonase [Planctomycetota bacterium]
MGDHGDACRVAREEKIMGGSWGSAWAAVAMAWGTLAVGVIGVPVRAADVSIDAAGAIGDGTTLCTVEIQRTIDEVSAAGGGRVIVPAGVFLTGAVDLKPGVELHLDAGAVLIGSTDLADYPRRNTRIEGHFEPWPPALVNAEGLRGVRITGAGTLDGNGRPFWKAFWQRRSENPKCTNLEVARPRLVYLADCDDVEVRGVTLKDAGFWNLHAYKCRSVTIDGITIIAPHGAPPKIVGAEQPWDEVAIDRAPSSDGIDIDSSQDITIRKCRISVGDDCIALKGTKGPLALQDRSSPPVERVVIEDCIFESGHGALTCGSEATVVRDVTMRRCRLGADVPLVRLKLRPDTPQLYENIVVDDIEADDAQAIFDVKPWTQFFDLQGHPPQPSRVRGLTLRNVRGSFRSLGELRGNPADEITGVSLEGVHVTAEKPRLVRADDQSILCRGVTVNGAAFSLTAPSVTP